MSLTNHYWFAKQSPINIFLKVIWNSLLTTKAINKRKRKGYDGAQYLFVEKIPKFQVIGPIMMIESWVLGGEISPHSEKEKVATCVKDFYGKNSPKLPYLKEKVEIAIFRPNVCPPKKKKYIYIYI